MCFPRESPLGGKLKSGLIRLALVTLNSQRRENQVRKFKQSFGNL